MQANDEKYESESPIASNVRQERAPAVTAGQTTEIASRPKSLLASLVDSAAILALVGAIFFGIGYSVQTGDAAKIGVPLHLLPDASVQSTLMLGFLTCITYLGIALVLFLVLSFGASISPQKFRTNVKSRVVRAYDQHPRFYQLLGILISLTLPVTVPQFAALHGGSRYADSSLPKITGITSNGVPTLPNIDQYRFLSRKDKCVVIKRDGKPEFVILRDEAWMVIELQTQK